MRNIINHITQQLSAVHKSFVRGVRTPYARERRISIGHEFTGYEFTGYKAVGMCLAVLLCMVFAFSKSTLAQTTVAQIPVARTPVTQTRQCGELIDIMRLVTSEQICRSINNNWACYGNAPVQAFPSDVRFDRPRDRANISDFETISTSAPDGVVLMRLLTSADPINIAFFGNMEVTNAANQGFLMRLENGERVCEDTPAGLVARTEKGEIGKLTVNGVEIELGSTVFATLKGEMSMFVTNVEGSVRVAIPRLGMRRELAPGEQVQVLLVNNTPVFVGEPRPAAEAASPLLQWLGSDESGLAQVGDLADAPPPPTVTPSPTAATSADSGEAEKGDGGDDDGDDRDRLDGARPGLLRRILQRTPRPRITPHPTSHPTPRATPHPTHHPRPTPDENSGLVEPE